MIKSIRTTFTIDREIVSKLEEMGIRQNKKKSQIVSLSLMDYFERNGGCQILTTPNNMESNSLGRISSIFSKLPI